MCTGFLVNECPNYYLSGTPEHIPTPQRSLFLEWNSGSGVVRESCIHHFIGSRNKAPRSGPRPRGHSYRRACRNEAGSSAYILFLAPYATNASSGHSSWLLVISVRRRPSFTSGNNGLVGRAKAGFRPQTWEVPVQRYELAPWTSSGNSCDAGYK